MGMDVYGKKPTSEQGQYFRRNVWCWHPLAELVCEVATDEAEACRRWHTNDGDGLNASQSKALAERLQQLVDDGTIPTFIKARDERLAGLPSEPCEYCACTGIRSDARGMELGLPSRVIGTDTKADITHPRFGKTGWCNSCNGIGYLRPSETHYAVDLDDVIEFIAFLRCCGGFYIC